MPRSESRSHSSRRSRSRRSRSRRDHHHRHHHSHRSRTRLRIKYKEKNFASAVCSMLAIVVLSTALAEPDWINLKGGGCEVRGEPGHRLGATQFFYPGHFLSQELSFGDDTIQHQKYQFGPDPDDVMDKCVTYKAVLIFKTVIAFCFLGILCSLFAFILDLVGPKARALKLLRRNAIMSIVTVIICVVINLFCYWMATEIEHLQTVTKLHTGSKVVVDFDVSFYLVTGAGCAALFATAFNCLRTYPMYEDSQGESLLDDYDGMDPVTALGPDMSQLASLPPPPAYTP